jgi:hypothetical protein
MFGTPLEGSRFGALLDDLANSAHGVWYFYEGI